MPEQRREDYDTFTRDLERRVLRLERTTRIIAVEPAPGTGDKNFVYSQGVPASIWTIAHGLNKYPSVTVVDSVGNVIDGNVIYVSPNTLRIEYDPSLAFSGTAYLN